MNYWKIHIVFFCLVLSLNGFASVVDIGLLDGSNISSVLIAPVDAGYEVYGDGTKVYDLKSTNALRITVKGGKVSVSSLNKTIGKYSQVKLVRTKWGCSFKLLPTSPKRKERAYPDNLTIKSRGSYLRLINNVYLEHYVAGVVEAETYAKQDLEFYKAHAIISRTYALKHLGKHQGDGFNLCDQVHCQAYKGKSRSVKDIVTATYATRDIVLVDSEINLITASFSSNCGGQTNNAEDVWTKPVPYLKSVRDTFCIHERNARWEQEIAKNKWIDYLGNKYNFPISDTAHYECAVHYIPYERERFFSGEVYGIPLKELRTDWRLKSTYFSLEPRDGKVVLKGKGFGHGVGLCQEGSMKMARVGFTFSDILHYYYTDVHLIDLSVIDFFRAE